MKTLGNTTIVVMICICLVLAWVRYQDQNPKRNEGVSPERSMPSVGLFVISTDKIFPNYKVGDVANFYLQVPEEASPVTVIVQSPDTSMIEFTLEQNGNVYVQKEISGASGKSWRVFPRTPNRQTTLLQKEMPSRIEVEDGPVRFKVTDANGVSYEPSPIAVTVD